MQADIVLFPSPLADDDSRAWSRLAACEMTGVSVRTARTLTERYPASVFFPCRTTDLLGLRVLAAVMLHSPPPQSTVREALLVTQQRDEQAVEIAKRVWWGRMWSALVVVGPQTVVLCPAVSDVPVAVDAVGAAVAVVLPVGAWASALRARVGAA